MKKECKIEIYFSTENLIMAIGGIKQHACERKELDGETIKKSWRAAVTKFGLYPTLFWTRVAESSNDRVNIKIKKMGL